MPMLLFEEEKLLDTAVYIGPGIVPRVAWVMLQHVNILHKRFDLDGIPLCPYQTMCL